MTTPHRRSKVSLSRRLYSGDPGEVLDKHLVFVRNKVAFQCAGRIVSWNFATDIMGYAVALFIVSFGFMVLELRAMGYS